jgi:hypothetical protein
MADLCSEPHPGQAEVLCDKPTPCLGYHANAEHDLVWGIRSLPSRSSNRAEAHRIASNAAPARRTGPPVVEQQAKTEGMQRSEVLTTEEFRRAFLDALRRVALDQERLTSDDVWVVLAERGVDTDVRTGVGPMMANGARMGWIAKTGDHAVSGRPNSKARDGLTVWRSLLR